LAVIALVGVVIGVGVREMGESDGPTRSRLGERVELVELIAAEQQRVEALRTRVGALSEEVAAAEQAALADAGASDRIEAALDELAVPGELSPVEGPGVRVDLDDAVDGQVRGASVDDVIIH
jgi:uncharacterized protein YlxW (UPF0749 family)